MKRSLVPLLFVHPLWAQAPPRTDAHGDPLLADAHLRIGSTRLQHGAPVRALAFSADCKSLASVSRDQMLRLWDSATGQERLRLGFDSRFADPEQVVSILAVGIKMGNRFIIGNEEVEL